MFGSETRAMMSETESGTPVELFCSYAHADEALVSEVLKALDPLVESGLLAIWQDRQIYAGRSIAKAGTNAGGSGAGSEAAEKRG